MRKILLILCAALAITFVACNNQKKDNPSIADTSAKQTQPAEAQAQADQANPDSANNLDEQAQNGAQDQAAAPSDQPADPSQLSQAPTDPSQMNQAPADPAQAPAAPQANQPGADQNAANAPTTSPADNNTLGQATPAPAVPDNSMQSAAPQMDESKDAQAQVPALPQDSNDQSNPVQNPAG